MPCHSTNKLDGRILRPKTGGYLAVKVVLDRVAAIVLLLPALPIIGVLIVAIRLTSKGPGVYSQPRVGKCHRPFVMYKLRSMRIDAEAKTGPVWSSSLSDPRVTPLGYWLRRLHLDELPQLFNVLKGEMSLIGPRPERPEFVKILAEQIEHYTERLRIPPGITGLAQVNLPPDTDLDSVRRKLTLDREYLETASLSLDIRIILCTLLRVVGVRGGRGVQWLGLHRTVLLPDAVTPIGGNPEAPPATPHSIASADGSHPHPLSSDTVPVKAIAGLTDTVATDSRRAPRPANLPLSVASEA